MNFDFLGLMSSKPLVNKGTLKDFCSELTSQGYKSYVQSGHKKLVHVGKNGRKQMFFRNREGKEILLYISRQLDDQLSEGENVDLENCIVYVLKRHGYSELVLGVNLSFEIVGTETYN